MRHFRWGGKAEACWGWPWAAGSLMNGSAVRGWDVQTDITVLVCICCTCDTGLCGNRMPVVHMGVWGHIFLFLRVFTAAFGPHTSQVFVCFCTGCTCGCLSICIQLWGGKKNTFTHKCASNLQRYNQTQSSCYCCNEHNQGTSLNINYFNII